jgi:NAD(P)-dependent dehydrogenase (short-subunit alcohol dehydrogenase family)
MRLSGKTAVITGAASGIGAGAARLFAEHGAHLILVDQNE